MYPYNKCLGLTNKISDQICSQSQVRGAIAPRAPAPYQVGRSCFRWLLPTKDLQKHDCTREFVQKEGIFIEWASDTCRLVAYPCSNSKVYNLCAFVPSREVEFDTQADGACLPILFH
jgi:salicylate hydroxylase